jgi:predicted dehydrogenase
MLRIALIGCGEHSRDSHAAPLSRLASERPSQITLAVACDLNLERAEQVCRQFAFAKPYSDYRQMLDREKPDGCVCVMPMPLIAAVGQEMMTRHIPCVIEKPMGATIQEVRKLAQVAQETKTMHMVSVNRRFLPHLNQAIRWAAEQGPLRFVRAAMLRINRQERDFAWGTGMHVVDALRHIGGEMEDFRCESAGKDPDVPWYSAALRFAGGALGSLQILPTAGMDEEIYDLCGEGFRATVISHQATGTTLRCWRQKHLVCEEALGREVASFVFRGEYEETAEFLDALSENRSAHPVVSDVLPSAELCAKLQVAR